jgi:hypothetical protein
MDNDLTFSTFKEICEYVKTRPFEQKRLTYFNPVKGWILSHNERSTSNEDSFEGSRVS